jgi:type I restriction enzyme, S subunit
MPLENLITDHLETWTTAQVLKKSGGRGKRTNGQSSYGIKKLRELILDLAVRGKLVPQDPKDEPARKLLPKNSQKSSKNQQNKEINPRTILFNVPNDWIWERFGNIAKIERGGSPRPIKSFLTEDADGLNWIKIGDTEQGGKYITSTHEKIRQAGLSKTRMVYPGDFLLTNSMSFGRPYITKIEGCIHDGWLRISPPSIIQKDYLYHLLSSAFVFRQFQAAAAGAVVMNLNAEKVRELALPIPPLAEQNRIVAKVDELMALCDLLEQEQTDNSETHQLLVKTLLDTLTHAQNHQDFIETWQQIEQNFDVLFTTEASVDELKQTILQLAVMGKLVPQDTNDEPASVLLEKIAVEKARLVKEGKIKKQRVLLPITETEMISELPDGWEYCRLGELSERVSVGHVGNTSQYYCSKGEGIMFLRSGNVKPGRIQLGGVRYITRQFHDKLKKSQLKPHDLLVVRVGANRGDTCLAPDDIEKLNCANIVFARPMMDTHQYLQLFFMSPLWQSFGIGATKGSAQGVINTKIIEESVINLPPIGEQHRIVAKVNELIDICDSLKEQLNDAQSTQVQLADAIVGQAV